MTEQQALLNAIINEPKEDTPRLVYADWLEEHGEDERAEFIRVQIEINDQRNGRYKASPENDKRQDWLSSRERELWRSGVWDWHDLPWGVADGLRFEWHNRGFVSHVTCSWNDWKQHYKAITSENPIEEVRLTTWPDIYLVDDLHKDLGTPHIKYVMPTRDRLQEEMDEAGWITSRLVFPPNLLREAAGLPELQEDIPTPSIPTLEELRSLENRFVPNVYAGGDD